MNETKAYASFWIRLAAGIIEGQIWSLWLLILLFLFSLLGVTDVNSLVNGALWIVFLGLTLSVVSVFFRPYLISKFGGDFGKLAFGLSVELEDGSHPSYKRALFRESVAKLASGALMGLGFYWIFRNEKRQGWHDALSDTFIVRRDSSKTVSGLALLFLLLLLEAFLIITTFLNFSSSSMNVSREYPIREFYPSTPPKGI